MTSLDDQLRRLRVALQTGYLPRDLGRWLAKALPDMAPAAKALERRNALLRRAGAQLAGSKRAKAQHLATEIRAVLESPRPESAAGAGGVRALVAEALEVDPTLPAPMSLRQLQRIL